MPNSRQQEIRQLSVNEPTAGPSKPNCTSGMRSRLIAPVPIVCVTGAGSRVLGISLPACEVHVQPTLRLVQLGRAGLVPIEELQR